MARQQSQHTLLSITIVLTVLTSVFCTSIIVPVVNHHQYATSNSSSSNNNEVAGEDVITSSSPHQHDDNFILIDFLPDGEMERRISYRGIVAKETKSGNSSHSIRLWQLTNGKSLFQVIYSSDNLMIECEHIRQKSHIDEFVSQFYREYASAKSRNFTSPYVAPAHPKSHITDRQFDEFVEYGLVSADVEEFLEDKDNLAAIPTTDAFGMRNLTYAPLESFRDLPADIADYMKYNELKMQCKHRRKEIKQIVRRLNSQHEHERIEAKQILERHKRDVSHYFIMPNTKWCGNSQLTSDYRELGGLYRADSCCRRHDHCKLNIDGFSGKWNYYNFRPFTLSHCQCDTRKKRDLNEVLIFPGTKWCGRGYLAKSYNEIGGYSKADRCCRQHDKKCPYWIAGFESKYGLFNWRVQSVLHCNCDERFRTCLKMADCPDANMVGKLFFNIVQTKCFVLKREKICRRYKKSRCIRVGQRKRAQLRNNRPY